MNILLFGDDLGIPRLLRHVPKEMVCGLVAAANRPHGHDAIHKCAHALGVPCAMQPFPDDDAYVGFVDQIRAMQPDLMLVSSYSMIIRNDVLALARNGACNLHAALLPRNRGPNPIQWAIIKDEPETGMTLHYMDDVVDGGDIISSIRVPIQDEDTWVSLRNRLTAASEALLAEQLPLVISGRNSQRKQDESMATVNPRLTPDSPKIEFEKMSDRQVFNLIRAQVKPLQGAYIEEKSGRRYFPEYMSLDAIPELRKQFAQDKDSSVI